MGSERLVFQGISSVLENLTLQSGQIGSAKVQNKLSHICMETIETAECTYIY